MALTTINPAAGQDTMSTVYTKTNACINAVNETAGGSTNQFLKKTSGTDFDFEWTSGIVSSEEITYSTGWSSGGGAGTTVQLDVTGRVEFNGNLGISTGGTTTVTTLSTAYRPLTFKRFAIADYNGTDGASVLMIININTTGEVTIYKQSDGTKPSNRTSLNFNINYSIR